LFAAINGWTPTNFFWRSCLVFHLPRTLHFSLLSFNECSLFLLLRLVFVFRLDLCSDLVISLHQGVFWPLVHVVFHQKSCFKKVRMVLEKRKNFMQKSGTKKSLYRLRPRLLHVVLDVVLIVCLVIFATAWLVSNDWDCLMSLWKKSCVVFIIWKH
jgi:sensor histidine kinase YesM